MPDEVIVKQCSPTLAGIKTGNLFPVKCRSQEEIYRDIRQMNRRLMDKGVKLIPLQYADGRALLYMYRPSRLRSDLQDRDTCVLLEEMGYSVDTPEACLAGLIKKFHSFSQFPHEVGLFLGYPPEDVRGFIQNKACGCKCVGCWKVYGDEAAAKKKFSQFKKCTSVYCRQWECGKSIEQLTVAG